MNPRCSTVEPEFAGSQGKLATRCRRRRRDVIHYGQPLSDGRDFPETFPFATQDLVALRNTRSCVEH